MTIRPYEADDAPALLGLLHALAPPTAPPPTLEEWRRQEEAHPARHFRRRLLLLEGDEVVAHALLFWHPFIHERDLELVLGVAPGARKRGHGTRLLGAVEREARARGASRLHVPVRDDRPEIRAWAERRGYGLDVHRFSSELDLAAFDESRFPAPPEGVEFTTMSGADADTWDRLADFYADLLATTPDMRGLPRWTRDQVLWQVRDSPRAADGEVFLAGENGRWLGLSALGNFPTHAYNEMTGVIPEARGRGLALALKLHAIRVARAMGHTVMRTNNLDTNAPMLAVNRKLGFRPLPGRWMLARSLT